MPSRPKKMPTAAERERDRIAEQQRTTTSAANISGAMFAMRNAVMASSLERPSRRAACAISSASSSSAVLPVVLLRSDRG